MKYYVCAKRVSLDGYPTLFAVSNYNTVTECFEETRFFDSEGEALLWTKSDEAKEWKDCTFVVFDVQR